MATEPALRQVDRGGRLTKALLGRLVRRIEALHEKIDDSITQRTQSAPPALREPEDKVKMDAAYLQAIALRIESAWAEISAAGFTTQAAVPVEPALKTDAPRGFFQLSVLNRIIRRIEYLHSLSIGTGS